MQPQIINNKDFTEVNRVLEGLKLYINQKLVNANNFDEPISVNQDMSLASQPEITTDHIEETEFKSTVDNTNEIIDTTTVEVIPEAQIPVVTEPVQVSNELSQNLIETSIPNQQQIVPPAEVQSAAMLDTSATALTSTPIPEMNIENTLESPVSVEANQIQNAEESAFVNTPQEMIIPELPAVMELNPSSEILDANINNPTPLVDSMPDFTTPADGENTVDPTGYATTNNVSISENVAAPNLLNQEPVIMPNGITEDMANSQEMVTSPESFGATL